ncbi:MAG: hypothetical protein PHV18_16305 [Lachnospiraceae bacterium]|nr:hypothetical protein [Lachnospiraceae bacterium]
MKRNTWICVKDAVRNRLSKRSRRKLAFAGSFVIRNYKDTIFRMLYKDKQNLLSLYNAVNRTHYTDVEELVIVTLENAIYLGYKNDLAFLIGDFMNLYEQQSTYNPNMPLRMLLYVASEYERLIRNRSLYTAKLQKIPTPRFIIFYNGQDKQVEQEVQKLSSAFLKPMEDPELELKVTLYNINVGHNQELLEQCRTLAEYAQYVSKVRNYAMRMSIGDAVSLAVNECIREDILADFLRENKAEVVKMSIFEYDKEVEEAKHRAVLREVEGEANQRAEKAEEAKREAEERSKKDRQRADQAEEAKREVEERAKEERKKIEERAKEERQKVEERAKEDRQRADQAERELAVLKEKLARLEELRE